MKRKSLTVTTLLVLGISSLSLAEEISSVIPESRYVSVQVGATPTQRNLLESVFSIHIPEQLGTIGEALPYLLHPYGFRLLNIEEALPEQALLLTLALPDPHRTLAPITLIDALKLLGGESFEMTINPVKRTVSYALRKGYRQFVTEEEIEQAVKSWTQKNHTVNHYGPVKRGEILSGIVTTAGLNGVTLDQRMVQVYQANQQAFLNNMNALKKDVLLNLTPHNPAILSVSAASRFVDEHHRLWLEQKVMP
jgi:type IV pili sensor histidine kinase/response regulator